MIKLLTILFILFTLTTQAKVRYVSSSTGNDSYNGLTTDSAYASIAKVSAIFSSLASGDTVLFKRGDVFYGTLSFNKNGTPATPMYLNAYGTGSNPVISGLTTLSSWTLSSGNIYYAPLNVATLNLVMLNGVVQGMGRYPNTGYLHYQAHTNNTAIKDRNLTNAPNWTGGEVVIRKYRWILDRQGITNHTDSNITYNALRTYGNNSVYSPVDNNGYFIQNHLGTLDQNGEWYFDTTAKRLYMYFGSGSATGNTVQASTINNTFVINSLNYSSINNIDIEGSNTLGVNLSVVTGVTFNNCNFRNHGGTGLYANGANTVAVNNCTFTNCLNNGEWLEVGAIGCTVNNSVFTNIGMIAGMAQSGDGVQEGIEINGNNTTITNCTVRKIGYCGINFNSDNALIQNNYVDSFCMVKDDGGGIYTYGNATNANRVVKKNVVLNAVGAVLGTEAYISYENFGKACAFYFDGNTNHVLLDSNMFANGGWNGIFVNNNAYNQVTNNTTYNFAQGIGINESSAGNVNNITVTNNKFIAKTVSQLCAQFNVYTTENPTIFGTFNNNIYARPVSDSLTIQVARPNAGSTTATYTLAGWQAYSSQDAASAKSPISITDPNTLKFDYNTTSTGIVQSLSSSYKDVSNNIYATSYTLPQYSGRVLIPYTISRSKIYIINVKIAINPAGKILTTQ